MKIVILIFLILLLCGCNNTKNVILDKVSVKLDDSYIEVIPTNAKKFIDMIDDNEIIMDKDEIIKYNLEIAKKTNGLYNLDMEYLEKDKIVEYINKYKIPKDKYNNGIKVTNEEINKIIANLNIDSIPSRVNIKKALTVNRCNLLSFPTNINFYDNPNLDNFNRIAETELHINTPLLILHESKDKNWYLVMSNIYVGWVNKDYIVLVNDDDYNYFINNDKFGIITESSINIDNIIFDMSSKLVYNKVVKDGYEFIIPSKDSNNNLVKKIITITKDKAHLGYLPYTKNNVIVLSFKYESFPYSWSGFNYGVDCSSYIRNIFGTFGFIFPRNTSEQSKSVGNITDLSNLSNTEKLNIIKNVYPSLLYKDGHVVLYIGCINNVYYVINASGNKKNLKVLVENLDNYLKGINKLITVN